MTYGTKEEQVFLGRDFNTQKNFSDETAKLIDLEVKALVMSGHSKAHDILNENRESLERMAKALLDLEPLNLNQMKRIIDGKDPGDGVGIETDAKVSEGEPEKDSRGSEEGGDFLPDAGLPDPSPA